MQPLAFAAYPPPVRVTLCMTATVSARYLTAVKHKQKMRVFHVCTMAGTAQIRAAWGGSGCTLAVRDGSDGELTTTTINGSDIPSGTSPRVDSITSSSSDGVGRIEFVADPSAACIIAYVLVQRAPPSNISLPLAPAVAAVSAPSPVLLELTVAPNCPRTEKCSLAGAMAIAAVRGARHDEVQSACA